MTTTNRRRLLGRSLAALAGHVAGSAVQRGPLGVDSASAQAAFDVTAGIAGCYQVALIFNIGSGYEPAYGILDTLGAYGVTCSMFVMGWLAEQNPALVQTIAAWGHPVGSHGYIPPELTVRSDDDVYWDLQAASGALSWALGYAPVPWFTPYASASDARVRSIASSLGLVTVGWSVGSNDWSPDATADSVYGSVMNGVFDGAIVELHLDSQQSINATAVALPWILNDLTARGYRLVTVPQVVNGC